MPAAISILDTIRTFVAMLKPHCVELTVGGSVRREKPDVKDVKLIVMPQPTLLPFLDRLVANDTISKALYGGKPRWGDKYRGMVFAGVKFEIFTYDADNRGYQLWLRTGPGDAGHYVMGQLSQRHAPFGFQTHAYLGTREWKKGKLEFMPNLSKKLRLSSEHDLFTLLGLPFIEPKDRSVERYTALMTRRGHTFGDAGQFLIEHVETQALFADSETPVRRPQVGSVCQVDRIDFEQLAQMVPYLPNASFEDERQELVRQLLKLGVSAEPSEKDVQWFADQHYRYWERQQWERKQS